MAAREIKSEVMKNAIFISDVHRPYHDQRAWELMMMVAEDYGIDEFIIGGDFADFYGLNSHGKNPHIEETLIDELASVHSGLMEIQRSFPSAKKVYITGNHEHRLARYIANKAPELFGVIEIEDLLQLKHFDFEYVPYGPYQGHAVLGTELIARHEPLTMGLHCAYGTIVKTGTSTIFGHTHRKQEAEMIRLDGTHLIGIAVGHLADYKHPVMSYLKNHPQWTQGFCTISADEKTGEWFYENVRITEGYKCKHNGFIWTN